VLCASQTQSFLEGWAIFHSPVKGARSNHGRKGFAAHVRARASALALGVFGHVP
jgi:hypothetical protein